MHPKHSGTGRYAYYLYTNGPCQMNLKHELSENIWVQTMAFQRDLLLYNILFHCLIDYLICRKLHIIELYKWFTWMMILEALESNALGFTSMHWMSESSIWVNFSMGPDGWSKIILK